jgi:predicted component of type VI protein secretion system
VSRRHAELKLAAGRVTIRDLGSSNGTRVNGQPLTAERALHHGDRIEIGPLSFTVLLEAPRHAKPRRRAGDDEVAAWLIGEEHDAASAGSDVPAGATAISEAAGGGPERRGDSDVTASSEEKSDEAYDLLKTMSLAGSESD